jgi:hypothetical protein
MLIIGLVPDFDENGEPNRKFVPAYEYAGDNNAEILHNGKKVKIVNKKLFDDILSNSSGTADWLRGQVINAIKTGEYKDEHGDNITEKSPQADQLARHILFEKLSNKGLGGMKDFVGQKETPIKNITNVYAGNGDSNNSREYGK